MYVDCFTCDEQLKKRLARATTHRVKMMVLLFNVTQIHGKHSLGTQDYSHPASMRQVRPRSLPGVLSLLHFSLANTEQEGELWSFQAQSNEKDTQIHNQFHSERSQQLECLQYKIHSLSITSYLINNVFLSSFTKTSCALRLKFIISKIINIKVILYSQR